MQSPLRDGVPIQLRPSAKIQRRRWVSQPVYPRKTAAPKPSLSKWIFVYLPLIGLAVGAVYVLVELLIKHMAVKDVHNQLPQLPDTLEALPVLPLQSPKVSESSRLLASVTGSRPGDSRTGRVRPG